MKKHIGLAITLLFCMGVLYFMSSDLHGSVVKSKYEGTDPQGDRKVEFVKQSRKQGVRFYLRVDGDRVITTEYFKKKQADFNERLVWNAEGSRVAIEVGGKRLAGYDVLLERELSGDEVLDLEPTSFDRLSYRGRLPVRASNAPPAPTRERLVLPGLLPPKPDADKNERE